MDMVQWVNGANKLEFIFGSITNCEITTNKAFKPPDTVINSIKLRVDKLHV